MSQIFLHGWFFLVITALFSLPARTRCTSVRLAWGRQTTPCNDQKLLRHAGEKCEKIAKKVKNNHSHPIGIKYERVLLK